MGGFGAREVAAEVYETYLAETTHGDAMGTIAVQVANYGIGGVGFEGDAIVVVVDGGILDGDKG